MKEYEVRRAVINPDKQKLPQVMFLGGHTDDDAMFKLTAELGKRNIGVTIATLTNSDGRDLPRYQPEELAEVRWGEAITSGMTGGITEVRRIEIPDGRLKYNMEEGLSFAGNIIDEIKPIAIVTPHVLDPHIDHEMAYFVGEAVAGFRTPHYMTDTITGFSREGELLVPDFIIPISEESAQKEIDIYLANASQVEDIPEVEMADVQKVIAMTERHGQTINTKHAAALNSRWNTKENPLFEIFEDKIAA